MQLLENKDHLLLRLERGEEVVESLTCFVQDRQIPHALVQGIGAIADPLIGAYDLEAREYRKTQLDGGWEVLSLMGNVGWLGEQATLHSHVVLGDMDCAVRGGHLFAARVHVTLEVALFTGHVPLPRAMDDGIGLNLWKLPHQVGDSPF